MARAAPLLTDAQWTRIDPLLPKLNKKRRTAGRPWVENRPCLEGILWILRTGARWRDLPEKYPAPATCWRRLKQWEEAGVWQRVWRAFLKDLDAKGALDWEECFIDATFAAAKKGVSTSVSRARAKGRNSSWSAMAQDFLSESSQHLRTQANQLSPKKRSEWYEYLGQVLADREARLLG